MGDERRGRGAVIGMVNFIGEATDMMICQSNIYA